MKEVIAIVAIIGFFFLLYKMIDAWVQVSKSRNKVKSTYHRRRSIMYIFSGFVIVFGITSQYLLPVFESILRLFNPEASIPNNADLQWQSLLGYVIFVIAVVIITNFNHIKKPSKAKGKTQNGINIEKSSGAIIVQNSKDVHLNQDKGKKSHQN